MLPLHRLRAPLSEALVETSVTWLGLRFGDDRIGQITQIDLIADEVSSPLWRGIPRGARDEPTGSLFGLLPRASRRSYRERVRALTEIAETFLPRSSLRSRYVRFRSIGVSDTEEVV